MRFRLGVRLARVALGGIVLGFFGACVFKKTVAREIPKTVETSVRSPVKAHMTDGSIVVFANGSSVRQGWILGAGMRYPLEARPFAVTAVPIDSVVGVETFDDKTLAAPTALASAGAVAVGAVAFVGLMVAIFGSCPTFYADSAGSQVLEAEAFSYAIAPLFEHRDTDRLRVIPGPDGVLRLYVRNEALETHYINHVELMEVLHSPAEIAVTDGHGRPVLMRELRAPSGVLNAAGKDVTALLVANDGRLYQSDRAFIDSRSLENLDDHVDFTIRGVRTDSVAVVLRMRNSLLNTVLLYEEILARSGPRALDWIGQDLNTISTALDLGRWYANRMGMTVAVRDGTGFRKVSKTLDSGPIAFHDVVVIVPTDGRESVDVRLSFVADNWRIESLAYTSQYRRVQPRPVPITDARSSDGGQESEALNSLGEADDRYLKTTPGQTLTLFFDTGAEDLDRARTYFLATQGYYIEWIRGAWLRDGERAGVFTPSDASVLTALRSWSAKRAEFENQFYASRIPVR